MMNKPSHLKRIRSVEIKKSIFGWAACASLFWSMLLFAQESGLQIDHPVRRVEVDRPVVALTFDDGPDGGCRKYLELFAREKVKATFFVKGKNVEASPGMVKAMHEAGFEIGTHSFSHADMTKMSLAEVREETVRTQTLVKEVTGEAPKIYRAPFLKYNQNVWDVLTELQLPAINASVDAGDWRKDQTVEDIYVRLTSDIKSGDILLMHSWSTQTQFVMPQVIKQLRADGFEFVTVSELLALSTSPLYRPLSSGLKGEE